ncbi:SLOG family protein [Christensenellaceae bacterium OttesenSCG-928-K19]|nr:SLOG family protein [Christensenellaceae bacterium OttesenSCG-928-K19]
MKEITCCVAGHRDLPSGEMEEIQEALEREVRQAAADGYTCFLTNFMEGTGLLFAYTVAQLQQEIADIRLEAVLPYNDMREELMENETARPLLLACADVQFSGERRTKNSDSVNHKEQLRRSSRMIVVFDGREAGGTVSAIRMAHLQRIQVREIPLGL